MRARAPTINLNLLSGSSVIQTLPQHQVQLIREACHEHLRSHKVIVQSSTKTQIRRCELTFQIINGLVDGS
jgi:hypothetical protein